MPEFNDRSISLGFDGKIYQNNLPYNGWYERGVHKDEYYIDGRCVATCGYGSNKFHIFYNDELEFNSREEVERVLKLLAFI